MGNLILFVLLPLIKLWNWQENRSFCCFGRAPILRNRSCCYFLFYFSSCRQNKRPLRNAHPSLKRLILSIKSFLLTFGAIIKTHSNEEIQRVIIRRVHYVSLHNSFLNTLQKWGVKLTQRIKVTQSLLCRRKFKSNRITAKLRGHKLNQNGAR